MRVVLDTNVLISAEFWSGAPRTVVDLAVEGRFQAVTSVDMLLELDEVLDEKFSMWEARSSLFLTEALSFSAVCMPERDVDTPVRDADDRKVIACAMACEADYIVTGDRDLLALGEIGGTSVLTVREFLDLLGEG